MAPSALGLYGVIPRLIDFFTARTCANTTYNNDRWKSLVNTASLLPTVTVQSASFSTSESAFSITAMTFIPESAADNSLRISMSYLRVYASPDMKITTADVGFKIDFGP